tara:strand:- start:338 stop:742 length:405 start_codon:yes stop_codon:yes gene_type:complete
MDQNSLKKVGAARGSYWMMCLEVWAERNLQQKRKLLIRTLPSLLAIARALVLFRQLLLPWLAVSNQDMSNSKTHRQHRPEIGRREDERKMEGGIAHPLEREKTESEESVKVDPGKMTKEVLAKQRALLPRILFL